MALSGWCSSGAAAEVGGLKLAADQIDTIGAEGRYGPYFRDNGHRMAVIDSPGQLFFGRGESINVLTGESAEFLGNVRPLRIDSEYVKKPVSWIKQENVKCYYFWISESVKVRFLEGDVMCVDPDPAFVRARAWDDDGHWNITTRAGDTLRACHLVSMVWGSLVLSCDTGTISISCDSVGFLTRARESRFWSGALLGTLTGMTVGSGIGLGFAGGRPDGIGYGIPILGGFTAGAIAGFTIGGVIGSLQGSDEVVDLEGVDAVERLERISELLLRGGDP